MLFAFALMSSLELRAGNLSAWHAASAIVASASSRIRSSSVSVSAAIHADAEVTGNVGCCLLAKTNWQ